MSRLNNLYLFLNDEKGRTLPRAKLFFYENNSFNFKNTYADKALTSVNPNPVIADGAGRFPNIFLEADTYRVVLQDEDGVEISTKDDVDNLLSDGDNISNTTVTTSTGSQTVAGALDDRVVRVGSVAALKMVNSAILGDGSGARITDTSRAGDFKLKLGDYTAAAIADPLEGIIVPASGRPISEAAWVRDLSDGAVNLGHFGFDNGSDPSASFTEIIKLAESYDVVLEARGNYNPTNTLHFPSGEYYCDFRRANFEFPLGVTEGATIGDAGASVFRGIIDGLEVKKVSYEGINDTGIALLNAVESAIHSPRSINFENSYGFMAPNASRVAYNDIYSPLGQDHETGILVKPQVGGYCNENTVHGGRLGVFFAGRLVDQIRCDNTDGTGAQHNRFLGVSIEGYSGGGSCGRSAFRCINTANENVALFCRAEKYNDGWDDAAYYFDSTTSNNYAQDSRFDADFIDLSGKNQKWFPSTGLSLSSLDTAAEGTPGFRYVRRTPVTLDDTKYLIDVQDVYSPSGKVGGFRYQTPRSESGAGSVISISTGFNEIFRVTDAGDVVPRDNFAKLGQSGNRYAEAHVLFIDDVRQVNFTSITAATAVNGSLFLDSADGVLKFKDGGGVVNPLY